MIEALVMHANASHGFCGAMVNAIMLAREKAELRGLTKVTPDILLEAQKQMSAGTKIEQLAKQARGQTSQVSGQLRGPPGARANIKKTGPGWGPLVSRFFFFPLGGGKRGKPEGDSGRPVPATPRLTAA